MKKSIAEKREGETDKEKKRRREIMVLARGAGSIFSVTSIYTT